MMKFNVLLFDNEIKRFLKIRSVTLIFKITQNNGKRGVGTGKSLLPRQDRLYAIAHSCSHNLLVGASTGKFRVAFFLF